MLFWLGVVQIKKYSHLQKNRNSMGLSHGIYQIQNLVESHYYNHYEKWVLVINYHSLIMLSKLPWNQPTMRPGKKQCCNCNFFVTADSKQEEPGKSYLSIFLCACLRKPRVCSTVNKIKKENLITKWVPRGVGIERLAL